MNCVRARLCFLESPRFLRTPLNRFVSMRVVVRVCVFSMIFLIVQTQRRIIAKYTQVYQVYAQITTFAVVPCDCSLCPYSSLFLLFFVFFLCRFFNTIFISSMTTVHSLPFFILAILAISRPISSIHEARSFFRLAYSFIHAAHEFYLSFHFFTFSRDQRTAIILSFSYLPVYNYSKCRFINGGGEGGREGGGRWNGGANLLSIFLEVHEEPILDSRFIQISQTDKSVLVSLSLFFSFLFLFFSLSLFRVRLILITINDTLKFLHSRMDH